MGSQAWLRAGPSLGLVDALCVADLTPERRAEETQLSRQVPGMKLAVLEQGQRTLAWGFGTLPVFVWLNVLFFTLSQ